MPKQVCVSCESEMWPAKNGVYVEEHIHNGDAFKIWHADLYHCPICGVEVITGFAIKPTAHYLDSNYADEQKRVTHHIR